MGSETVIFILLAVLAIVGIEWRREQRLHKETKQSLENARNVISHTRTELQTADKLNMDLEAEILRLRKIPLTGSKKKADDSVIKARSAAQVRSITESAFGKPEDSKVN